MRTATLALSLLSLVGCGHGRSGTDGGDGDGGPCVEGAHACAGAAWQTCQNGGWVTETTCPTDQVCSPGIGCTPCLAGATGCDGDQVVACDANGQPTQDVVQDCSPLTCAVDPASGETACVGPCDAKALAKSYTGCVYYAVDLPQWGLQAGLGFGTVAADQQFAVAVANPWKTPLDVTVERNDAAPGSAPQIAQVMTATVAAGGLEVLPLPQREASGFVFNQKRSRSLLTNTAYRITTTRPASVYQFNPQNNPGAYSNDASLLIPQNALDESYLVLGWPGRGGDVSLLGMTIQTDNRSFVTLVATRAGTKVRVTPSTDVMAGDNVPAMHKGGSYTFTLDEFETLNLEGADYTVAGATDFTGTRIEADGPLAVWSGVECITINPPNAMNTCCCDHLEEQLFPRSSLGHDYVVVRSEGRSHNAPDPEFFRVLALDDNTDVQTSLPPPDDHFTLGAGDMHEVIASDDFVVTATGALMIGQFQVSQDSSLSGDGDPSFELVPPVAQHRPKYIFLVPSGYGESWLLVSLPTNASLTLDGQPAAGCERQSAGMVGMVAYDAARCPVQPGTHTIESKDDFGLVVEGWGPGPVSYGYTGGMEFKTVNGDCGMDGDCPQAEFCSGGTCVPIIQ